MIATRIIFELNKTFQSHIEKHATALLMYFMNLYKNMQKMVQQVSLCNVQPFSPVAMPAPSGCL